MRNLKGISPLISYAFAMLLAIVIVTGVAVLIYNFYQLVLQDQIKRDLTQVAAQTSSKITEIYAISKGSKTSPSNSTAILMSEAALNLPQKVADRGYKLTLLSASQVSILLENVSVEGQNMTTQNLPENGKIVAETTEDPIIEVQYDLPSIDVDLQGSSGEPSNATLRYYRYNPNGTVTDAIVLGDYALLGQVTVLS